MVMQTVWEVWERCQEALLKQQGCCGVAGVVNLLGYPPLEAWQLVGSCGSGISHGR